MITDVEKKQYARYKQTQTAIFVEYQTEASENSCVAGARGLG